MSALKQIDSEITSLENIHNLVQTYEEIAAGRMQKVKTSVLVSRDFLSGLDEIFQQVKFSYRKELESMKEGKGGTPNRRNGKTVSVLLSANTGLYGDIVQKTFDKFLAEVQENDSEIVVVGKIGKSMYEATQERLGLRDFTYFDLSDNASRPEDFEEIISHIVKYEKVIVFHGKFQSILSQVAIAESLTGDMPETKKKAAEQNMYIFEPNLQDIITFFESEILASIFEQAMHESNLSKYASRMVNLDNAVVNISESLEAAKFNKKRIKHRLLNKKQLSMISSMSLWN